MINNSFGSLISIKKSRIVLVAAAFFVSGFFVPNASAATNAVLGVTQISAVQTFATADGTFNNGWKWVFDVTVPTNETTLKLKFADWVSGSNSIPAGSNIQFYSAQSSNAADAAHAIAITTANTYSGEMDLIPASDLNSAQAGRQIQVIVEARVPVNSAGGSYSTSYGIFSAPDTTAPVITLIGDASTTLEAGSTYTDRGATASDNVDGDITSKIVTVNPVNTSALGTYVVTYNVSDIVGNVATQVTRTINVVDTAAQAAAEEAVAAYEAAPITTLAEVLAAEALKAPADSAVELVLDETANTTLTGRIAAQTVIIASAKTSLEAAAAAQAAADKLAADHVAADPVTAQIAALPATVTLNEEAAVTAANTAFAALTVDQKALVTNADVLATDVTAIANLQAAAAAQAAEDLFNATAAVVTAETSKLQADVDAAQLLVTALPDGTAKMSLQARIEAIIVTS